MGGGRRPDSSDRKLAERNEAEEEGRLETVGAKVGLRRFSQRVSEPLDVRGELMSASAITNKEAIHSRTSAVGVEA